MYITLNQKTSHTNNIYIFSKKETKNLQSPLQQFTKDTLNLKKDDKYKVGLLPIVGNQKTQYNILINVKDFKYFSDYIEDVIAEIGAMIKKLEVGFELDLDKTSLKNSDKILLQELLIINLYKFTKYKKDKKIKYTLNIKNSSSDKNLFDIKVQSLSITRELVNDPSNSVHPKTVQEEVEKLFSKNKNIKMHIIKGKELEKKGLNGIYQVGKGSEHDPRLILIEYKGSSSKGYDYGLVGKGVCFDTGGYNIKPTGYMEDMKIDMAGAATVIGVINYVISTKLNKNIIFALPLVENMISHNAYKPGDVITMYNGKTVEVGNTDAEGRLILADSLSYIEEKYNPETVFNFATLTGAQVVALGNRFAAIIGRNSTLNRKLQDLGTEIKDRVRELPFYEAYFKSHKSDIADMNNISTSGKMGPGAITAGLFLSQFIKNKNRVHFDIAGPASIPSDPITGGGATGATLRLISQFLENNK